MSTHDTEVAGREYRFGDFRFIPARQLLLRKGAVVRLGSRAADLLHIMVSRAGEVVGKDELTAFVWPGARLHDSNLKVTMSALRRALPHRPKDPPIIVTVAGRGYRFTAPVRIVRDVPAGGTPDTSQRPDRGADATGTARRRLATLAREVEDHLTVLSLHLRAATDLAQVLATSGHTGEAAAQLAAICTRVDVALEGPDLQRARELLGALTPAGS